MNPPKVQRQHDSMTRLVSVVTKRKYNDSIFIYYSYIGWYVLEVTNFVPISSSDFHGLLTHSFQMMMKAESTLATPLKMIEFAEYNTKSKCAGGIEMVNLP